jgi:arylsulfatase A-like enzyme
MYTPGSSLARAALFAGITACAAPAADRPNILFAIADDLSYPHMSAYGTTWVTTPAFDRVASQGILFQNGYTPNAKCGPSRASVLTGRQAWELGQIGNHIAVWPANAFRTYVEALAEKGYHVGQTGKGWAPGRLESGSMRSLTGRDFSERRLTPPTKGISANDYAANFAGFLDAKAPDQPWCFWYGASEPHRHYEYGSGVRVGGKKTSAIENVPGFLPDNETVRNDLLDYALEIEHFDRHLGRMIALLEERGELDNTLIVITADNGMPFPRAKGMQYEYSNHVPLAMMWPKGIRNPGRVETSFVSFVDFAPTFLKIAGVDWKDSGMEPTSGKDLVELFADGYRKQDRSYIVLGQERHDYGRPMNQGYPIRSIIQEGWLYIHNLKPDLWPAGNPETGYLNTDGSPSKTAILDLRRQGIDRSF